MEPKDKALELYRTYDKILEEVIGIDIAPNRLEIILLNIVCEIIDLENFSSEGREYWEQVRKEIININNGQNKYTLD